MSARRPGLSHRTGLSLVEALIAACVLLVLGLPVLSLASGAQAMSAGCLRRVLVELRAREHLAEAAATEHGGLLSLEQESLPTRVAIAAAEPDRLTAQVRDLDEKTRVEDLEPGLARVVTRIAWVEPQTGRRQRTRAVRLICRATLGLEDRVPREARMIP